MKIKMILISILLTMVYSVDNVEIYYISDIDIASFQFDVETQIFSASGGDAEEAGLIVSTGPNGVLGIGIGGQVVPAGNGVLTVLVVEDGVGLCLSDLVVTNLPGGENFEQGGVVVNCDTILFESTLDGEHANGFSLQQNYPNPFNPTTQIEFSILNSNHVNLAIYDILGKKITTLLSSRLLEGDYQINWDGTDMNGNIVSSGIYMYQLSTSSEIITRRMTLLR